MMMVRYETYNIRFIYINEICSVVFGMQTIFNEMALFSFPFLSPIRLIVPQVMILGPPASGKRTISKMVCAKLKCAHITADNLLEEADVNFKLEIQKYQQQNKVE